jgi:hypothetical protein
MMKKMRLLSLHPKTLLSHPLILRRSQRRERGIRNPRGRLMKMSLRSSLKLLLLTKE